MFLDDVRDALDVAALEVEVVRGGKASPAVFPYLYVRYGGFEVDGRGRKMLAEVDVISGPSAPTFDHDPDNRAVETVEMVVKVLTAYQGAVIREIGGAQEVAVAGAEMGPRVLMSTITAVEV